MVQIISFKLLGSFIFSHFRISVQNQRKRNTTSDMTKTEQQYRDILQTCRTLFLKKNKDYGTSWRIMRLPSITDQIFIKAARIRSIQEKGSQKVDDSMDSEFIGIINYCIIALIQKKMEEKTDIDLSISEVEKMYDAAVEDNIQLLSNKNHDYGEAWREMRVQSITDIILMKIHRLKQIENNLGQTLVSEGIEANYQDILNYSVFALILNGESKNILP